MKALYLIAVVTSLSVSATAFAARDAGTLFKQYNCTSCHSIDGASVGPSLKAISTKYADEDGALIQLEKKVRNGGSGSFGSMPMPATPKSVSDENIKTMVRWILLQH